MNPNTRTRLVSTLGIVVAVAFLVGVAIRLIGGIYPAVSGESRDAGRTGAALVALDTPEDGKGVTAVASVGGWKVTIRPGEYEVSVRTSERSADDVRVYVSDDTLSLDVPPGVRTVNGTLEATVWLPHLDRLEIDGGAEVRLEDIESDRLAVDVDGAASITATGGRYGRLTVDVDGAANIDFSGSAVVDASVDMDGASNLRITMAGGTLTGYLRGVGNVSYGGEVADESIRVEGLGRVRAR